MWGSSAGRSGYDVEPQRTAPYAPESDLGGTARAALVTALLLAAAVIAAFVWMSARSPGAVTRVRYVNDTGATLVVTPCGASRLCVVAPGASIVRKPPPEEEPWRVVDERTHEPVGCIRATAERTVKLSETRFAGYC